MYNCQSFDVYVPLRPTKNKQMQEVFHERCIKTSATISLSSRMKEILHLQEETLLYHYIVSREKEKCSITQRIISIWDSRTPVYQSISINLLPNGKKSKTHSLTNFVASGSRSTSSVSSIAVKQMLQQNKMKLKSFNSRNLISCNQEKL